MATGAHSGPLEELDTRPGHETLISGLVRRGLIALSVAFLAALLLAPLAVVFVTAFQSGLQAYLHSFADPDTQAAIRLTLLTAAVVVPVNTLFGLAAAWAIAKFEFRGKSLLITLIDLPIAVSPVISGMLFVLLFGMRGWFGAWLAANGISLVFAIPGIMIATLFVTFPYVARELIPLMQQLGNDEEEAAITLRAGGWGQRVPCNPAQDPLGTALWSHSLQRARHGRIRRSVGGLGPYPGIDQYHATRHRSALQRLRLHGRLRGGLAPHAARVADPRAEVAGGADRISPAVIRCSISCGAA